MMTQPVARLTTDPRPLGARGARSEDLAERARLWWITRDPRVLWPALESGTLQPSADAIGRAVAALLRRDSTTLGTPTGHDAYAIGIAALLTGTGPLLGRWVEEGSLDVSDELAAILAQHLAHGRARAERIARGAAPALSGLVAAGVTPVVIKGFHTAHVYFSEPGLRPIADVDLVVAADEVPRAEQALHAAGFRPSSIINRPYKREWYPADDDGRFWSFELFDARDRWTLELHDGPNFGNLPALGFHLGGAAQVGTRWNAYGVPALALAQPALTVVLAAHFAAELHVRRLLRLVELIFIIRRDRQLGILEWDALDALLDESGARRFVYPALALVERLAPGTIDPGVLARGRRATSRLARLVTHRLSPTRPILEDRLVVSETLMWVTTPVQLIRSIAHWVNPLPGRPWRQVLALYHSRVRRLLSGRVSWFWRRGA